MKLEAETTGAVALLAARDEFEVNLLAIKSCVERQVVDITGYAQAKALMVERMVGVALVVAKGTLAYAEVVGDRVLAGKMKVGSQGIDPTSGWRGGASSQSILDAAACRGTTGGLWCRCGTSHVLAASHRSV